MHHHNNDNAKIRQTKQSTIKNIQNLKNMIQTPQNLQEYYNSLSALGAKGLFQQEVMGLCGCGLTSIRDWCKGRTRASKYKDLKALSKATGISINNLFKTV